MKKVMTVTIDGIRSMMHNMISAGEGSDPALDSCGKCPYYRNNFKFRTCLLDRMSLSAKNNWLDKQGLVFIIYTVQEVQDSLGCAEHGSQGQHDDCTQSGCCCQTG